MKQSLKGLRRAACMLMSMVLAFALFPATALAEIGESVDAGEGQQGEGVEIIEDDRASIGVDGAVVEEPPAEEDAIAPETESMIAEDEISALTEEALIAGEECVEPVSELVEYPFGRVDTFDGFDDQDGGKARAADPVAIAKQLVRSALLSGQSSMSVDYPATKITFAHMEEAFWSVLDEPSFFYVVKQFRIWYVSVGGERYATALEFSYICDKGEIASVRAQMNDAVAGVTSWIPEGASDDQRLQAVHDWLVRNCEYDESVTAGSDRADAYSAFGAIVGKMAVCQGYAEAYKMVANGLGFPCLIVTSDSMNHAWNLVKIGGTWYHVDATWDDPVPDGGFDFCRWDFFLKSDTTISDADHQHTGWVTPYQAPSDFFSSDHVYATYDGKLNDGKTSISFAKAAAVPKQPYIGKAYTPAVQLTLNGKALSSGQDYVIEYENNTEAGTATAICRGRGSYFGDVYVTFSIEKLKIGWSQLNGKWYYCDTSSGKASTGWKKIGSDYYLLGADGAMKTGWQKDNGNWYYLEAAPSGKMKTGWQQISGKWYYFEPAPSGKMATGWKKIGSDYYLLGPDGDMKTGWQKDGGIYYYLEPAPSGKMARGWKKVGTEWYWLGTDGGMRTGWQNINGDYYYLEPSPSGKMATGWKKLGSDWYHLGSDGVMRTGWQQISGKWYYFAASPSGKMMTGWQKIGSNWYLLGSDGAMKTGWQLDDGKYYYLEAAPDGKMVRNWKQIGSNWYWFGSDGILKTGWQKVNGNYYYLDDYPSGKMITGWVDDGTGWYYLSSDGIMQKNKWIDDTYYVGSTGAMATSCWIGDRYVGEDGKWDKTKGLVYWTPGGSKYHLYRNCTSLKQSTEILSGSVADANRNGKAEVCNICKNMSQ